MHLKINEYEDDCKRISKLGMFLRKSSLDELPSLINIIKGEMSFVGPRPLLTKYLSRYSKKQQKRHNVMPGLSGLAQIKGRNLVEWEERINYDIFYVDNQCFLLDLKILLQTVLIIFQRKGISPNYSEIMPEFKSKN